MRVGWTYVPGLRTEAEHIIHSYSVRVGQAQLWLIAVGDSRRQEAHPEQASDSLWWCTARSVVCRNGKGARDRKAWLWYKGIRILWIWKLWEPVKDFREVTLSTFSTQKNLSGCTAEISLGEVQTRSPPGWLYESWEQCWESLNLAVAAMRLEHTWKRFKSIWWQSACVFFWFVLYHYTDWMCTIKHFLTTLVFDLKKQNLNTMKMSIWILTLVRPS